MQNLSFQPKRYNQPRKLLLSQHKKINGVITNYTLAK